MTGRKDAQEISCTLVGTDAVKELTYLVLEEHYECYNSHTNQLVEDASEEAHLENLRDEEPHQHENNDANEDVERTRLLH